ncbi:hypothetical protein ACI8AV_17875 [Geodermatophilus sp. SYSU D00804]
MQSIHDRDGRPIKENYTAVAQADAGGQVTGLVAEIDGDRICIAEAGSEDRVWVHARNVQMVDGPQ